jgi:hypothetical protein
MFSTKSMILKDMKRLKNNCCDLKVPVNILEHFGIRIRISNSLESLIPIYW